MQLIREPKHFCQRGRNLVAHLLGSRLWAVHVSGPCRFRSDFSNRDFLDIDGQSDSSVSLFFSRCSSGPSMQPSTPDSIFVSIASYRDPEAQHTIANLFATAARPERISVGVCHQLQDSDREHLFRVPYPRPDQVRELLMPAADATGPCLARHRIQKELYGGEEYFLQFDSHMRCVEGWDDYLVAQLNAIDAPKPILTTYPAGYTLPEGGSNTWRDATLDDSAQPPFLVFSHFGEEDGMMRFSGRRLAHPQSKPIPSMFCVSGFCFARGSLVKDCMYDPNLPMLFFGEETLMTLRMWTHGYDFYVPGRHVCYHLWERTHRPVFQRNEELRRQSLNRVRAIIAGDEQGIEAEYGLGKERSVDDYFKYAGLDFTAKSFSERARLGGLSEQDFYRPEATIDAVLALLSKR